MARADTITGRVPPYVRRRRRETRARWLAARARNALRRPFRLATVGGVAFIAALVTLVVVPRDARQRASRLAPRPEEWRDTTSLLAEVARTRVEAARAESSLAALRLAAAPPAAVIAAPTLSASDVARRDSLTALDLAFGTLLTRVESAPLPATYRALGEAPAMRGDARVRALLDSLADVERERDEFGSSGGVDPIFVSLTARATAIGRAIEAIAEARRADVRRQLAMLQKDTTRAPPPVTVHVDTMPLVARRDSTLERSHAAERALVAARATNAALDRRLATAREQANIVAPPVAILFAALVLGLAVGFGATLAQEIRLPRVSDLAETEFVAGSRVLAVLKPRSIPPERARRRADRGLPPLLDPTADPHRLLASHLSVAGSETIPGAPGVLARAGAEGALVTLAGDDPVVSAVVAANVAAASANDSRGTMLVDADVDHHAVARVLRVPSAPGLAEVLRRRIDWPAAALPVVVGRDRTLDVVPSGALARGGIANEDAASLRRDLERAARRYDLVLVHLPLAQAARLQLTPEVLVCAHIGHTPLATLRQQMAALHEAGARIVGLVLWGAERPVVTE